MEDTTKNPRFIDIHTLSHFLSGVFFFGIIMILNINITNGFLIWLIIHSLYELKDLYFTFIYKIKPGQNRFFGFVSNNSFYNTISDTLFSVLGFYFSILLFSNNLNTTLRKIIFLILITIIYLMTCLVMGIIHLHIINYRYDALLI